MAFFGAFLCNKSTKVQNPSYERGRHYRPYKRTFDMPTCLVPSAPGQVLICLTILQLSPFQFQ